MIAIETNWLTHRNQPEYQSEAHHDLGSSEKKVRHLNQELYSTFVHPAQSKVTLEVVEVRSAILHKQLQFRVY